MSGRARLILALALAAVAGIAAFAFVPRPSPELSRAEFLAEVHDGHVRQVEIEDQDVIIGVSTRRGAFRTPFGRTEDAGLPAELRALGVEVRFTRSGLGLI